MKISNDDIQDMLHKIDLINRPLAIVCNPDVEQELKDKLGNGYLYYSNWAVEKDKIYVVDRQELEDSWKPQLAQLGTETEYVAKKGVEGFADWIKGDI